MGLIELITLYIYPSSWRLLKSCCLYLSSSFFFETGATTKSPERFRFPSSISNLTSSSWVFNGESVWKDGKKISSSYGSCSLESLVEGSTVGLMKKNNCLHLYINGADQGVADGFLPPGPVYPIVDLYGRCTRVSIIQPSELTWQQYSMKCTLYAEGLFFSFMW